MTHLIANTALGVRPYLIPKRKFLDFKGRNDDTEIEIGAPPSKRGRTAITEDTVYCNNLICEDTVKTQNLTMTGALTAGSVKADLIVSDSALLQFVTSDNIDTNTLTVHDELSSLGNMDAKTATFTNIDADAADITAGTVSSLSSTAASITAGTFGTLTSTILTSTVSTTTTQNAQQIDLPSQTGGFNPIIRFNTGATIDAGIYSQDPGTLVVTSTHGVSTARSSLSCGEFTCEYLSVLSGSVYQDSIWSGPFENNQTVGVDCIVGYEITFDTPFLCLAIGVNQNGLADTSTAARTLYLWEKRSGILKVSGNVGVSYYPGTDYYYIGGPGWLQADVTYVVGCHYLPADHPNTGSRTISPATANTVGVYTTIIPSVPNLTPPPPLNGYMDPRDFGVSLQGQYLIESFRVDGSGITSTDLPLQVPTVTADNMYVNDFLYVLGQLDVKKLTMAANQDYIELTLFPTSQTIPASTSSVLEWQMVDSHGELTMFTSVQAICPNVGLYLIIVDFSSVGSTYVLQVIDGSNEIAAIGVTQPSSFSQMYQAYSGPSFRTGVITTVSSVTFTHNPSSHQYTRMKIFRMA